MRDLLRTTLIHTNPKRSGHKAPYQVIKEDIYEMARRRNMSLEELMLSIYLRGKSCRYGNPFKLTNTTIYHELNTTKRIITPLKKSLQTKGILKYNKGDGKGHWTEYIMLDSVMIHSRDKSKEVRKCTP